MKELLAHAHVAGLALVRRLRARLDSDRGQGTVECVDDKWLVQNPAMNGYTAIQAYLPTRRIALALTVTKGQAATATTTNYSQELFKSISEDLTPDPQVLFP
jgi:hypothetical protein